jgi:uncharacterized iron-regulated membrane protein
MGGGVMRKTIFWLHLITGVTAGIVILVMSITGVLLMYQRQVTAWADGAVVKIDESSGTALSLEALMAKVREVEPKTPTTIAVKNDPAAAVTFTWGREKTLFVDPYSGRVIGEGSKAVRSFFQSMIDWHRWLGMSGENRAIGKAITGACNLGFLFLVISGFYLWWPRSLKAFRAVVAFDFSLSGKARDWNWHNVAGFWSAIPLFFVVSTATFFSYPWATNLLYRLTGNEVPKDSRPAGGGERREGPRGENSRSESTSDFAEFNPHWAIAAAQAPDWQTITLRVPAAPNGALNYTIDRGNGARPDLRTQITIDLKTGAIQKTENYSSYNSARKIRLWSRWIHTGEAGGFLGQTIAGVASGAGALLVWTGFALAWRRFRKRKEAAA